MGHVEIYVQHKWYVLGSRQKGLNSLLIKEKRNFVSGAVNVATLNSKESLQIFFIYLALKSMISPLLHLARDVM